ncbi:MAG: hypothetical protein WB502_14570 [Thermoactinomyces sp.]
MVILFLKIEKENKIDWKIVGGITLGAAAITALFRKYGQQIKSGVQSAYNGAKQWMRNMLYPNRTLKDCEITDKQLAYASDMTYKDVISEQNIKKYLGEKWIEDKNLSRDLLSSFLSASNPFSSV